MSKLFDELAKGLAGGVSRRKALLRFGGALAAALGLAGRGPSAVQGTATLAACNDFCNKYPAGSQFLACRSTCLACPSVSQLCGATAASLVCCTTPANVSSVSCVNNACTITTCNAGYGNCDGVYSNGCETITTTTTNCGACGVVCKSGQTCTNGACLSGGASVPATFNQTFVNGKASPSQCAAWNTFRAGLSAATTYTSVTIKGSNDQTGVTCTGTNADTLVQALRTGKPVLEISCGGRYWAAGGTDGAGIELNANGELGACAPGYAVRPCFDSGSWGGVNGETCDAQGQMITVVVS